MGNLSFGHITGVVVPVRKATKAARVDVNESRFHLEVAGKMTEDKDHSLTSLCNLEHSSCLMVTYT